MASQPKLNKPVILWRKYIQRTWHIIEWPAILLFLMIVLAAGYFGLKNYYSSLGQIRSLPDILYSLLQLFIMGSNLASGSINFELEIVRLLAPIFPFYMIIMLFGRVFQERLQQFYLKWLVRDHVIICGMNPRALLLAKDFYERGYRIVVVDNGLTPGMREKCRDLDAIVLAGSGSDPEILRKAKVDVARYIIAVLDNEGVNAEAAVNAGRLSGESKSKVLTCYVHIADIRLWSLLRGFQLRMGKPDAFRVEFINSYNSGARVLLGKYPAPAEGIMIIGPGKIGENIAVEAARGWYYSGVRGKPRLVLVDRGAKDMKERLSLYYPRMAEACDITALDIDILSPEFLRGDMLAHLFKDYSRLRTYFCHGDDVSGVLIALSILPHIQHTSGQTVLCIEQDSGLAGMVQGEGLEIFPLLNEAYRHEVLLGGINAILARAIHEDYLQKQGEAGAVSNPSMVPWDELPEDLKESNRRSADGIMARLKAVGCDIMPLNDWGARLIEFSAEEVETMSIMEHDRWVRERLLQGYKYAPGPKNLEKKTSPYILDWDKLPEDIKDLDRNVVRSVPSFLAREGFQVCRIESVPEVRTIASPPTAL